MPRSRLTALLAALPLFAGCWGESKYDVKKMQDDKLAAIAADKSLSDEAAIAAYGKEMSFARPVKVTRADPPAAGWTLEVEGDLGPIEKRSETTAAERAVIHRGCEFAARALRDLKPRGLTALVYRVDVSSKVTFRATATADHLPALDAALAKKSDDPLFDPRQKGVDGLWKVEVNTFDSVTYERFTFNVPGK